MLSLPAAPYESATPILILLADQDDDTRLMYGEYLRRSSIEIEEAGDGREALAKALARPHDAVVTETRLPGISGYELCELLRRDAATVSTPIVVVTAEAYPANLDRARAAGADAVLVKPCLPDVLLAEMQRLIRRSVELRRHGTELRTKSAQQVSRAQHLQARMYAGRPRTLSRLFNREATTAPSAAPPSLVCPECDKPLVYRHSHIGGVSERHREQWDYYECASGCGAFQYRQRTRKLRKVL